MPDLAEKQNDVTQNGVKGGEGSLAEERDWDILLGEIEEGEVVPIIGRDLLNVEREIEGNKVQIDANQDFARKLAEILKCPTNGDAVSSVASVAAAFVGTGGDLVEVYDTMEWLVREAKKEPHPDSLRKLAEITPFRLFVTTTFDPWMEEALDEAGRKAVSLAYEPSEKGTDLPKDHAHSPEAFVYHLLGRAGASAFAVTEEDILEFMHQLLHPGSPRRPQVLFDALERSHLLFLGCRFPDWLTRFFVRMARGTRLGDPHGRRNWIAGGTVRGDKGLEDFLQGSSKRTKIFGHEVASEFVDELHDRWQKRYPEGLPVEHAPEAEAKGKVFLSYASEDLDQVRQLHKALEEKKILAWFDKVELKGGDGWDAKIRRNVRSCSLFVPLMSKHVLTEHERYFRVEWQEALLRQQKQPPDGRFVLPVRIDDAAREDHSRIPLGFQDIQWSDTDQFLDRIVEWYKEAQRARLDRSEGE